MYKDLILKKYGRPTYEFRHFKNLNIKYSLFYIEKQQYEYLKNFKEIDLKKILYELLDINKKYNNNDYTYCYEPKLQYFNFYIKENEHISGNFKISYKLNNKEYASILDLIKNYVISNIHIDIILDLKNKLFNNELLEQLYNDISVFSLLIEEKYNEFLRIKQIANKNVNLELTLEEHIYNDGKKYTQDELYYPYYKLPDTRIPDLLYFFQILCFYLHPKFKEYWLMNFIYNQKNILVYEVYYDGYNISHYNYIFYIMNNIRRYLLKYSINIENNEEINKFINTEYFKIYINEYQIPLPINIKSILNYFLVYCCSIINNFYQIKNEITQKFIEEIEIK